MDGLVARGHMTRDNPTRTGGAKAGTMLLGQLLLL